MQSIFFFLKKLSTTQKLLSIYILFQIFGTLLILTDYDLNSTKYLTRVVGLCFIFLTFSGLLYWICLIISKRKILLIPTAISLTITNIVCYFSLYKEHILHDTHVAISQFLIIHIIPARFMEISVKSGDLIWGIALAGYLGLGMIIYGYFFIKNKNGFDNKYEKQVMYLGGGTYLFLFPIIFVFTHFTFVGSNYQYVQSMIRYTDSAVKVYEKKEQRDLFQISELKWFPSLNSAHSYYKSSAFTDTITGVNNKKEFYNKAMNKFDSVIEHGWYQQKKMTYDDMTDFNHWVSIAYNFNMDAVEKDNQRAWYSDLSIVLTNTAEKEQDLLRHSIFYIYEAKDGSVYSVIDFNRTFKDHKMNYIFNLFFVLYHIIYLSLFAYLLQLHNNKHMKGKKITDKS